MLPLLAVTSGL
uniref:Uncharacterized protein n=1 Tax=Anguilla anguilla TaxID=7936 RepID=A0A0E9VEN9_ANGAN